MKLLDPKLDVVFKLLFAHVNNRDILIALLTAVLRPVASIDTVDVLNPEIPKDLPADKGAVLDIHVRLADGRHIDVEMQSELRPGLTRLPQSKGSMGEKSGHVRRKGQCFCEAYARKARCSDQK